MSANTRAMVKWLEDKDPDVWFATTPRLNWDNAVPVLKWIVSQPRCDKANAAMIFWLATPAYYAERIAEGEQTSGDGWTLIRTIIQNWNNGLYVRSELAWPDAERRGFVSAYERAVESNAKIRHALDIPPGLFGPFVGRQPRVPASLTPSENVDLWDLLNRLGTQVGHRPGTNPSGSTAGKPTPPGFPRKQEPEPQPGPKARAFGIGLLVLSFVCFLWVLYVNLVR